MWLYINVYTHALMIIWVMKFGIITLDEQYVATKLMAMHPSPSLSVTACTLRSSGR